MDTSEKEVIKRIIQIRNEKRITQDETGRTQGVSGATYYRIESENIKLSYKQLTEIASRFNMSVIDVITYPDTYTSGKHASTKASVKFEVDENELVRLGLKEKVLQIIEKDSNTKS